MELVALLPLLVAVALALGQLLAAGLAREAAGHAAEAGAVAMLEGTDPAKSAREAAPGWARSRVSIRVDGSEVHVHVRPPTIFPGLANLLAARASADAGPRP